MPEHSPAPTPHRAVYGFAIYLLFFTLLILYALWALLPTEQMGLTYLPDKYFALCLPIVALTGLALFIFFIYPAINTSLTPNVDDLATITDVATVRRMCGYSADFEINSWEKLKCPIMPVSDLERKTPEPSENCQHCNVTHRRNETKPIATLRFMDLGEANEKLFGT